jgi:hypothetical protein
MPSIVRWPRAGLIRPVTLFFPSRERARRSSTKSWNALALGGPITREQAKAKADAAINADAKSASRLISATCIAIMILAFVDFVYTVFK